MLPRLSLLLALLALSSTSAWAKSNRIILWSVQRDCVANPDLVREVEKKLSVVSSELVTLSPEPKRLGCQGAACAAQLVRECPGVAAQGGMLVGAVVEPGKGVNKIRIWMHDLEAGLTAYKDEYCQGCSLLSSLPPMVASLAEQPNFSEAAPGLTPAYCQKNATPSATRPVVSKIFVVLSSELKHKSAVSALIKQRLQSIAIEPVQSQVDSASLSLAELTKMTSKEPGSQVLVVEGKAGGKVEVSLFDGTTQRTEARELDCQHCDKDDLIVQVKGAVNSLLGHCFGDQCGSSTSAERVPPEACQPFQILRCGGGDDLGVIPSGSGPSSPTMAPRTTAVYSPAAKVAKGVLWGLFAGSAATSIGLFGANYSSAGIFDAKTQEVHNTLLPTAGVMAGMSVLLLAGAIPVTILDRQSAAAPSVSTASESTQLRRTSTLPPLRCPN